MKACRPYAPVCHRDGTVSYWSVYDQSWRVRVAHVPDRELAAMPDRERQRVIRHAEEHADASR